MATDEWTWTYRNHEIRVVTALKDNARLYVDGELLDTTNDLCASGNEPTLTGGFGDNETFCIEVFVAPTAIEPVSIQVNGERLVGSRASTAAS